MSLRPGLLCATRGFVCSGPFLSLVVGPERQAPFPGAGLVGVGGTLGPRSGEPDSQLCRSLGLPEVWEAPGGMHRAHLLGQGHQEGWPGQARASALGAPSPQAALLPQQEHVPSLVGLLAGQEDRPTPACHRHPQLSPTPCCRTPPWQWGWLPCPVGSASRAGPGEQSRASELQSEELLALSGRSDPSSQVGAVCHWQGAAECPRVLRLAAALRPPPPQTNSWAFPSLAPTWGGPSLPTMSQRLVGSRVGQLAAVTQGETVPTEL